MSFSRIWGIILRQFYLLKHSFSRWIDLLYWSTVELLLWGFITIYLQRTGYYPGGSWVFQFLGALILWNILVRAQQGVAVGFLEDVWARNLVYLFLSPLTLTEYLIGLFIFSLFKAFIATICMCVLASVVFQFKFYLQTLPFFLLILGLIIFAWSIGLLTMAFILYFGQEAEILAWALALIFLPFSAVFYPVNVLPPVVQKIAKFVPVSYIFENMRSVLLHSTFSFKEILRSYLLNLLYFFVSLFIFLLSFRLAKKQGKLTKIGE